MKQELSWELIEQALDEHKLEILEDYNYFEWLQNEMRKIRKKYEKPERSNIFLKCSMSRNPFMIFTSWTK